MGEYCFRFDISWEGHHHFPNLAQRPSSQEKSNEKSRKYSKIQPSEITVIDASHNSIQYVPHQVLNECTNLTTLNLSSNKLRSLPDDICTLSKLKELNVANNLLSTVPKNINRIQCLKVLNLSGNNFSEFPLQICEIRNLIRLQLGGNQLSEVPSAIAQLTRLEVLYLGGNKIKEIPYGIGAMSNLSSLVLCDNRISEIPYDLVKLNNLRSLSLHNNQLMYLPREILDLVNLVELSLRGNPLVLRFVKDFTADPPSLSELASRVIKIHDLDYSGIPQSLIERLNHAKKCPNPKCTGVYFNSQYHQIKFVDFCGKYRMPLLLYLCSPECISNSSATSSEAESEEEGPLPMLQRVLLG